MLRQFLGNPRQIGSIAASSRHLAARAVSSVDLRGVTQIVELGAGTGPITREIVRAADPQARIVAVELNSALAEQLRRVPELSRVEVINRSAAELLEIAKELGLNSVGAVVCSLPWTLMSSEDQHRTLDAVCELLKKGGSFVTLVTTPTVWLPSGRRVAALLRSKFEVVERSRPILRAVPPMVLYRCQV